MQGRPTGDHGARTRALVALAAICALLLAACGGGDEGGGGGLHGSAQTGADADEGGSEQLGEGRDASPAGGGDIAVPGSPEGLGEEPVKLPPGKAVRVSLNAVLAGGDPQTACGSFVTEAYLDSAFGGRGGCVGAQAPMALAKSLDVRSIEVDGSDARVVVVPKGGVLGGQRLTIGMVRQSGVWKIDSLRSDVPVGP